jgi:hypothetical protein
LDLYSDTGIWSEEYIQGMYVSRAIEMRDYIYNTIVQRMSGDMIAYSVDSTGIRTTVIHLMHRRIEITYIELPDIHIRTLETLHIVRKK